MKSGALAVVLAAAALTRLAGPSQASQATRSPRTGSQQPDVRTVSPSPQPAQPARRGSATLSANTGWTPPRTAWGDPDIAGIFTTDDELGVPFERPDQFAGREFVTDEEFTQRAAQIQRQNEAASEEFVAPRAPAPEGAGGTGPPNHWLERGKPSRRTSIVVDPADGKIPFVNDAARQRSTIAVNARTIGSCA